ncbi:MAG TPA: tRNA (adenosine(37)-N6)-dimethylallyltransferase MiaA [Cyclobacteriaceae bacterium]|nr:tRNA (adenosine(37)-N6)-dimethylallyltransferase MiaA [Cyclobacteriaceae bacterium]
MVCLQGTDENQKAQRIKRKAKGSKFKVQGTVATFEAVKKMIVIVGPTAAGKTAAAISIAESLKTEIISADSRQVFQELNIGTAKPSKEELRRVPHHFIGSKSIRENYDAGQYGREALALIHELFKRHDWLVMVGGSGLYIRAVLEGFDEMPEVPDGLREKITDEYQARGMAWLQEEVEKGDPDFFSSVDRQNPQRLLRALELIRASGTSLNSLRTNKRVVLPFDVIKIGLTVPREQLYHRIEVRMDGMIQAGLFKEAEQFHSLKNINALQTVGYREIFGYLDGLYNYDEAIRLLKRNSRRYAKRQLTWFQRDRETTWFKNGDEILKWLTETSLANR